MVINIEHKNVSDVLVVGKLFKAMQNPEYYINIFK